MRLLALLPLLALPAAAQPDPLAAVADALGGRERVDALVSVQTRTRTTALLDGEEVPVRATLAVRFPDAARWEVEVGGRTRVVVAGPEGAALLEGGSARAMPPAAEAEARAALWFDPLVLVARRAEVRTEALGGGLLRVEVPDLDEPLVVGLDAMGRPSRITTFREVGGVREYVEVQLWDYREVDGVLVPHRLRQAVGGVVTGDVTVESVQIDPDLADGLFDAARDVGG